MNYIAVQLVLAQPCTAIGITLTAPTTKWYKWPYHHGEFLCANCIRIGKIRLTMKSLTNQIDPIPISRLHDQLVNVRAKRKRTQNTKSDWLWYVLLQNFVVVIVLSRSRCMHSRAKCVCVLAMEIIFCPAFNIQFTHQVHCYGGVWGVSFNIRFQSMHSVFNSCHTTFHIAIERRKTTATTTTSTLFRCVVTHGWHANGIDGSAERPKPNWTIRHSLQSAYLVLSSFHFDMEITRLLSSSGSRFIVVSMITNLWQVFIIPYRRILLLVSIIISVFYFGKSGWLVFLFSSVFVNRFVGALFSCVFFQPVATAAATENFIIIA